MPAPRKYSQAQRDAVCRLSGEGLTSDKIVERCAAGIGELQPFDIKPRTVRSIIHERRQAGPERSADDFLERLARAEAGHKPEPEPLPDLNGQLCTTNRQSDEPSGTRALRISRGYPAR